MFWGKRDQKVEAPELIRVSKLSNPKNISNCFASCLLKNKKITAEAMGPEAVNNLIKSVCILKETFKKEKYVYDISFKNENKEKTVIVVNICKS